jgi:hypothetical protein
VGVSIGYLISQQYYNSFRPKLIDEIDAGIGGGAWTHWLALVPLFLFVAMVVKTVSRRFAWVGRYPLAFVVALFAGLQINAVAQAELGAQIKRAMKDVDTKQVDLMTASAKEMTPLPGFTPGIAEKVVEAREAGDLLPTADGVQRLPTLTDAERSIVADNRGDVKGLDAQVGRGRYWFGIVSNILLLLGTLTSLLYFYFSLAHKGVVGKVSRFGVWILMIGFGASFGYTVQGRIALAIGRAQDVMGTRLTSSEADQIQGPWAALVSVAIIIVGIAYWEIRQKRGAGAKAGSE